MPNPGHALAEVHRVRRDHSLCRETLEGPDWASQRTGRGGRTIVRRTGVPVDGVLPPESEYRLCADKNDKGGRIAALSMHL